MWLIWLLACTGTDGGGDTAAAVDPMCADAPVVTYETFGAGFLAENCQSCHASTATDREGAPDHVTFDTVEDVWKHRTRVLGLAASEAPTMPPLGGTTAEDRERLRIWLTCAEEGT